jgi:hypothetical protein
VRALFCLQGPISITVAAGGIGWQLYSSGVFSGGITGNCGWTLDHGVQVRALSPGPSHPVLLPCRPPIPGTRTRTSTQPSRSPPRGGNTRNIVRQPCTA